MCEKQIALKRIASNRLARQLKKWVKTPQKLNELTDIHISTCYDYFNEKAFPQVNNQIRIKAKVVQISFDYCLSITCLSDEHEQKLFDLTKF